MAPPKKPWYRRWYVWVAAVLVVGAIAGAGGGQTTTDPAAPTTAAKASGAATTSKPVAEPEPVTEPAEKVEPAADPTARNIVAEAFGTFATITKKGRGDGTVKLPKDATAALVKATHKGSSNFSIHTLDSDNEETDLLVNEIGKYSGTTFYSAEYAQPTRLKVGADGSWTVKIMPVSKAKLMAQETSGKGDAVLIYDGDAVDFAMKHSGESNFAVKWIGTDSEDLLVNEIGKYSGTIPVGAGPAVLIITADGNWTVKVE